MKKIRIEKTDSKLNILLVIILLLLVALNAFSFYIHKLSINFLLITKILFPIIFIYFIIKKFGFSSFFNWNDKFFITNTSKLNIKQIYFNDIMNVSFKDNYIGIKFFNGNIEMINMENIAQEDTDKILKIINKNINKNN